MSIANSAIAITGSAVKARIKSKGATRAAEFQEQAADAGIDVQSEQFQRILALLNPSAEGGDLARQQQLALLGLLGPEAQEQAQSQIQESPGQQFIRERQQRALVRNQAATGGLGGGNIQTALQEQAAGFAQQDLENQFSRLGGLAAAGQQAAFGIGEFGSSTSTNISNLLLERGRASAAGTLGRAQARAEFTDDTTSALTSTNFSEAFSSFSDSKLKDNIKKIGKIGRLNVYEWIWKTTGLKDKGFIAEEVQEYFPHLVEEHNGFLRVNYNQAIEVA